MSSSRDRLAGRVAEALRPLAPGDLVLVAVSGGADSTALLHLAARALPPLGVRLAVLHLDHGLREGSGDDRRFVAELAAGLELPLVAESADVRVLASRRGLGLEEAGRAARRAFFARAALAAGARAVALAHTLDDRAETLLLHLLRGAGARGLAGMRTWDGLYMRPLLGERRSALRDWLVAGGHRWREDPSNADLRFTRNRVRHEILPALASLNPRAVEALARTAELLAEDDAELDRLARAAADGGAGGGAGVPIHLARLAALPDAIARRIALGELRTGVGFVEDLGHDHVDAVLRLARGGGGPAATDLPGGRRIASRKGRLALLDPPAPAPPFDLALDLHGLTLLPGGGRGLRTAPPGSRPVPASGARVRLPLRALGEAPGVRGPLPGDRFRPLGGPGERPLLRYLRDRGVPREERPTVPLVTGPAGILWVVGHQIGEAARLLAAEPAVELELVTVP